MIMLWNCLLSLWEVSHFLRIVAATLVENSVPYGMIGCIHWIRLCLPLVIISDSIEIWYFWHKMANSTGTLELMDLPFEIICHIISFLSEDDIFWNLGFTCKTLLEICLDKVDVITVSLFFKFKVMWYATLL